MTVPLPQETLLAIIAVQQEIVETHPALSDVMSVVVRAAARLTAADAAVVELQEGEDMVYRATADTATGFEGLRLKVAHSLSGLCVRLDEPLRCDDCETDERVDRAACRRVNARSMLVTPLRFRGAPMGVLKVYAGRVNAFDGASAETLRLLVGLIAASMDRAREHEGLSERVHRDALTGLGNRAHIESAIEARVSGDGAFALAFLDLNGFKRINDERGHHYGDRVLQVVAERIASALRPSDLAARLGGDEFVVILDGVASRDAGTEILDRLLSRISEPICNDGYTQHISAVAGLALFPEDGTSLQSLLTTADSRMYAGKRRVR